MMMFSYHARRRFPSRSARRHGSGQGNHKPNVTRIADYEAQNGSEYLTSKQMKRIRAKRVRETR